MGILSDLDKELNKQLFDFVEQMDKSENKTFILSDWIKKWLAEDFIKGDCQITGYMKQDNPPKAWVEFSWGNDG